jgi:hypothetical protein
MPSRHDDVQRFVGARQDQPCAEGEVAIHSRPLGQANQLDAFLV